MLTLSEYGSFSSPRNEPPRCRLTGNEPWEEDSTRKQTVAEYQTFSNSLRMLLGCSGTRNRAR